MFPPNPITLAAQHLIAISQTGTSDKLGNRLPAYLRPQSNDQALKIQLEVVRLRGGKIGAWKCGVPTKGKIIVAPIVIDDIVKYGPRCLLKAINGMAPIEPEIGFVIGTDLPPRLTPYTRAEVEQAIASAHLAFELIGTRYATPHLLTFPEILADGLSNCGLLLGPAFRWKDEKELGAIALTLTGPEGELGQWEGRHPDGDPLLPLHWLANFLISQGGGLRSGQIVITGSYHGVIRIPQNVSLEMRYGDLGALKIEVNAPL